MMAKYDDNYKIRQGGHFAVSQKRQQESAPKVHTYLHYHSDMELLWIEEGETLMQVAGRELKASTGDLVIVNPFEVHGGETMGGPYAHKCICFDLELLGLPEYEKLFAGERGYLNLQADTDEIRTYFFDCFEAIQARPAAWELRAKGNLLLLFSYLNEKIESVATKEQVFAKAVLEFIEAHFAENVTSKEAAAYFAYDHSYFCRKFKALFSRNFGDFLNGFRISKAKEMLKTQSVSATAVDCGFQNISYFSRIFKAVTGQSPREFKKQKCG